MKKIEYFSKNNTLLADGEGYRPPASPQKINLNWWHIKYNQKKQNLGDMISSVVYDYLCNYYGLDKNKKVRKTRHLYAIGSILFFENQDATVWGTGSLHDMHYNINNIVHQKVLRRLDVRAVRGPLTRASLCRLGVSCPKVYGDPAVLMPLIYEPIRTDQKRIVVISYLDDDYSNELYNSENVIISSTVTSNWRELIDLIASAKVVISSSLHGIILAESYGVPAVLLHPQKRIDLFKYKDYYLGTDRINIPIVRTIEEGICFDFNDLIIPDIKKVQTQLIESFPKDLWA